MWMDTCMKCNVCYIAHEDMTFVWWSMFIVCWHLTVHWVHINTHPCLHKTTIESASTFLSSAPINTFIFKSKHSNHYLWVLLRWMLQYYPVICLTTAYTTNWYYLCECNIRWITFSHLRYSSAKIQPSCKLSVYVLLYKYNLWKCDCHDGFPFTQHLHCH